MSDYPISVAHAFPRPPPHKIAPQCLRFVTIAKRRMMNSMRSRYRCANGGGDDDDAYCTRVSNAHFLVVPLRQSIHSFLASSKMAAAPCSSIMASSLPQFSSSPRLAWGLSCNIHLVRPAIYFHLLPPHSIPHSSFLVVLIFVELRLLRQCSEYSEERWLREMRGDPNLLLPHQQTRKARF